MVLLLAKEATKLTIQAIPNKTHSSKRSLSTKRREAMARISQGTTMDRETTRIRICLTRRPTRSSSPKVKTNNRITKGSQDPIHQHRQPQHPRTKATRSNSNTTKTSSLWATLHLGPSSEWTAPMSFPQRRKVSREALMAGSMVSLLFILH